MASALPAQSVRGRLLEEKTGEPVEGAFVVLLDERGNERAGVLTDAEGRFTLRAPAAGRYRLRADRIGYGSALSAIVEIPADATLRYDLEAPVEAVTLAGVAVQAESRCLVRPEQGMELARVWEEARKGLSATRWTKEQGLLSYEIRRYERELDPRTLAVQQERSETGWRAAGRPFATPPTEDLVANGFVRYTPEDSAYYAPDAEVVLSDAFLDTHCFRLRAGTGDRSGMIGLAFEPVPGRDVPDVAGVLWLDRARAELRYLEYRYTDLQLDVSTRHFGGRLDFERLPGGAWVIRRWWIRGPIIAFQRAAWRAGGRNPVLVALKEVGGEVVQAVPTQRP